MNNGNNKEKITIIGPYPPPYGGVSIYIKRLKEKLEKRNLICTICDNSGVFKKEKNVMAAKNTKAWLLRQFLYNTEDIIHCHTFSSKLIILLSLFAIIKNKKAVVTVHSFRNTLNEVNLRRKLTNYLAKKAKIHFIAVGPKVKEKIISVGIDPKYTTVIPAFIPPVTKKEDIAEILKEVWNFIDNHNPVISANAAEIGFYNNQDLYGIDMCIDLCANLKQYYPEIGFVLCLPNIRDYDYFNKMKQRIRERGIEENFFFQTKPCQFYPILMKSDVFLRPTNTDGDAVSLREALYFKIPSVASDVILRPEGTILFKNRDVNDFTSKIKDVLDNYKEHKKRLETVKPEDNFEKIVKIYQGISI